jgi:D-arginine dehydrogenase
MKAKVVIIGGGVAGLSCGAAAVDAFDVTVLETELQPGYHSSGRSAAVYIEAYMNDEVHTLTVDSLAYHLAQGARPIGDVTVADAAHVDALDAYLRRWQPLCPQMVEIEPAEVLARVPILRPEHVARAVIDPSSRALDAHGLVDGFRRRLQAGGGRVVNNAQVSSLQRANGHWQIGFGEQLLEADIVVNAAGAWGDEVAQLAGVAPLGLQPFRRTALLLDLGRDVSAWPMIHRVQGGLYFKPEAGQLMVSLADQTPSPPCDAQPYEFDIAMAVARFEEATTVAVRRPGQTWAGLRTFLPDERPAVGFDPEVPGFFWLVGQGGFGMQTAPALAAMAARLLKGGDHPLVGRLAPGRFARAAMKSTAAAEQPQTL